MGINKYSDNPVGYTCSDINKIIKDINDALENAHIGIELSEDIEIDSNNIRDMFKQIINNLSDVEYNLEQLRHANATLREWGELKQQLVKELEEELSDAFDKIRDLQ